MKRAEREARRLRLTAYHEAGHAVADLVFGRKLRRVTIVPDSKRGTAGSSSPHQRPAFFADLEGKPTSWSPAKARYETQNEIVTLYAGREAEKRACGRRYNHAGARSDYESIGQIAIRTGSPDDTRNTFLRWLRLFARDLVATRWKEITRVAEALLERRTIRGDEIRRAAYQFTPAEDELRERLKKQAERRKAAALDRKGGTA